jgi:hypothetical protein
VVLVLAGNSTLKCDVGLDTKLGLWPGSEIENPV